MGFEVIVGSGRELVVVWLARQLCLHLRALLEGIVSFGQRVGVAALYAGLSGLRALGHHALQCAEGIEAAREPRVSVKLRKGLLDVVYSHAVIERGRDGLAQQALFTPGLKVCDGDNVLLPPVKYVFHNSVVFSLRARRGRHDGCCEHGNDSLSLFHNRMF